MSEYGEPVVTTHTLSDEAMFGDAERTIVPYDLEPLLNMIVPVGLYLRNSTERVSWGEMMRREKARRATLTQEERDAEDYERRKKWLLEELAEKRRMRRIRNALASVVSDEDLEWYADRKWPNDY